MYGRQSLKLQFLGFYYFIFTLKIFKVVLFLISIGIMFHTFELHTLQEFRPYRLVLAELLGNSLSDYIS